MKNSLKHLLLNIKTSFSGKNLYWHILAIVLTYVIVESNFDWNYFLFAQASGLYSFFKPALGIGFLVPVFLPLLSIIIGFILKRKDITLYGWLLGQAALLGWLISSFYKAFTGRVQPNIYDVTSNSSHSFNFGFMEHGIFWGWPSSHTTVAFAMSFALITYLGKKYPFIRYLALIYAFYIGIAVSFQIHWFSEFVAGALIGTILGKVVGNSYK